MSRKSVPNRTEFMVGFMFVTAISSLALGAPALGGEEASLVCPCVETITTYPYTEDFEEGFGSWIQVDDDDFDWVHIQGPTESSDTGPNYDHTTGTDQGHYVYTEASDNFENTGILLGPCFDLSSLAAPQLSLWYSMVGDYMGSLYVEISNDGCQTWNTEFELHGPDWDTWNLAAVNLMPYAGQTVCVRFRGVTGERYSSDMAIDDIFVGEAVEYDGGCCNLDTGECLGLMTEANCLASGNTSWHFLSDCSDDNFCPQPPPVNDLCINATVIDSLPFAEYNVSLEWATPDLPVSCDEESCDDSGYGIWYTYTTTEFCGARLRQEVNVGGFKTFFAVFSGPDCDNLTELECSSPILNTFQEETYDLEAGTTYWFLIGHFGCSYPPTNTIDITFDCSLGACCIEDMCEHLTANECDDEGSHYFGDHSVCEVDSCATGACCTTNGCEMMSWDECDLVEGEFHGFGVPCELSTCPPLNETCLEAIPVTDGLPAAEGSTQLASEEDDEEPSCVDDPRMDLWYAYTAVHTGTVYINTEGSEIDNTVLSIWDQCYGVEIACSNEGPTGRRAALDFEAVAGRTYYILFATDAGLRGDFMINIYHEEAPTGACCHGDMCTIDYQMICEDAGGTYGGDDTSCPGDDCNSNGTEDICDFLTGSSEDCNENGIPDECDIEDETSIDLDNNIVPDECDPDCNDNGIIDGCDVTCDGGCSEFTGCGESDDCQDDRIPDECQLEDEGCDGERHNNGNADLQQASRPDSGWQNYGLADDFTMHEDSEGSCIRFEILDHARTDAFPSMRVRIFENYDGLMDLPPFWEAVPVFDATYRVDEGTLIIEETGEGMSGLDLLYFTGTGIDWYLDEGDYAIHLTFPETEHTGYWASGGDDDSDCAIVWGDWWGWPSEICDDQYNLTQMAFSLYGKAQNDCNENEVPDECDIEEGLSEDNNENEVPDECEDFEPGDFDHDDDIDLDDFAVFSDCFGGPTAGIFEGCDDADFNEDGQVDLVDFADFTLFFNIDEEDE